MHRKCYRSRKAAEEIGAEGQGEGLQGEVKKIEPFEKFDGFGQITERVKLLSKKESVFHGSLLGTPYLLEFMS